MTEEMTDGLINIDALKRTPIKALGDRLVRISDDQFAYRRDDEQVFRVFNFREVFSEIVKNQNKMSLEIILQVLDLATSTMYVDDWYSHPRWDGKIERELR